MKEHGFDVIDVHHHYEVGYHALDGFGVDLRGGGDDDPAVELRTRLHTMDVENVRGAVILPGPHYLRPRGLADTADVNSTIAAYRDNVPDRFLAGVGVVEPLYGPAGRVEVVRCKEELGLVGISLHNGFQGVSIDSTLTKALIETIGEVGLIPFVHALGDPLATLYQVDALAKDFPDLTMIVLDAFYNVEHARHLPEVASRRPNLFFDLALMMSFEVVGAPMVAAVGADRFLYGTDQYSWPVMTKPFGSLLSGILDADLTVADKTKILSGNAKRILGL